jgi:hypothetical protein
MKRIRSLERWDLSWNPTQGMDACIYSVFVLSYAGSDLAMG